ncbi:MAG TPA: PEP-CTERM sorting domain-containing protein [Gemmatimonadales bacterium]
MALRRRLLATAATAMLVVPATVTAQITAGQTDDFEDGTTQGWIVGAAFDPPNPAPPTNVATGGPGGDGDSFLRLTALGGDGPGSRLSVLNLNAQWSGDWLAAGITHVQMHAINMGSTDLFLRIMIADPIPGPPTNVAFSATPIFVPAGSDWMRISFPLFGPGGLVAVEGSLDAALSGATELRLFHSEEFTFPPPAVEAVLGVDNITAAVVPEPGTFILLGSGIVVLLAIGRRGRRTVAR